MVGRLKNMVKNLLNPKKAEKLRTWQGRFETAKTAYSDSLKDMRIYEDYYDGTREVMANPNTNKGPKKKATNVRNIVYELIESQVDNSIPMPKVRAVHKEDEWLAKNIEHALYNEINKIKYREINDLQERTVPVQGGDLFHVEWDQGAGMHCTLGDVSVSELHPNQVIPQPCVSEIEKMDYIFLIFTQTKAHIKRKYGVDVQDAGEEEPGIRGVDDTAFNNDIVSQIVAYYRNDKGGIGMFSWVEDYILVDMEDYQERKLERCKKCGAVKTEDVCPICGSRTFKEVSEDKEELAADIPLTDGSFISSVAGYEDVAVAGEDGAPLLDEDGMEIIEHRTIPERIPYYKPNVFPLVLRKNISKNKKFLGGSDVDVIIDQQDAIKKLGTKIDEKLINGTSFATLPRELQVNKERDMNIVRVSQKDINLIGVYNLQGDISKDRVALADNYEWARSSLGITDAYQGKYDSSATSGTAKQYSINQTARAPGIQTNHEKQRVCGIV